jgi:IS5 family transposase
MNTVYPVRVNNFFGLVERLCFIARIKNTNTLRSKQMYGNIKLVFLVCYKEKLNVSYRRFVQICDENNVQRMLCLKRIPHYTTLQKFVQRTPKKLFEKLVKACRKLLNLKNVEASIDGTGFSNTNPSHYYCKRINAERVKNYTKTMFLTDNKSKLILNVKTTSDHSHETNYFKPLVTEVKDSLKLVLADKGYDSKSNREHCREKGTEVHIPPREQKQTTKEKHRKSKKNKEHQLFNEKKYKNRAIIEAINSAIKRTLGSYTKNKKPINQQKQVTIKAFTYNIEKIGNDYHVNIEIETD